MGRYGPVLRLAGRLGGARPAATLAASIAGRGSWAAAFARRGSVLTPAPRWPMHLRPQVLTQLFAGVRHFSADRKEGTVKMWNEERGFGFITPLGGGDDVFVHRSSLKEGVMLAPGHAVTYEAQWDDRKRKDRAADVAIAPPSSLGDGQEGAGEPARPAPAQASGGPPSRHHIVGAYADWAISRDPMTSDASDGGRVRHRLTVRSSAPKGNSGDKRREEFQIVGDSSWDKRLYPAGGDKEDTVVLSPGQAGSRAAMERGKGHGRNWAVEGRPGTVFDIVYDPETQMVSCEEAFNESR